MVTYTGFVHYVDNEGRSRFKNGEDRALIESGVSQILRTIPGERAMMPEFGSRVPLMIFEPLDDTLKNQLRREVVEAVLAWDDRLIIEDVITEESEDQEYRADMRIRYRFSPDIQNIYEMTLVWE